MSVVSQEWLFLLRQNLGYNLYVLFRPVNFIIYSRMEYENFTIWFQIMEFNLQQT